MVSAVNLINIMITESVLTVLLFTEPSVKLVLVLLLAILVDLERIQLQDFASNNAN